MAFSHSAGTTKVYCSGRDLSEYLRETSSSGEIDTAETSTFTSTVKTFIQGQSDATFSGEGIYDAAGTVGVDAVFNAAISAKQTVFQHFPAGDAIGAIGRGGGLAPTTKYEVKSPVEDVNQISFEVQSSTGFEPTITHQPKGAKTGGGTATSTVDAGAASANGGAAYFQVFDLTGGTAVVRIQDSTDDSTYTDLALGTVVAGGSALRVPVTGAVKRYTRATWAVTGGTATFHAAFARNP